MELNELLKKIDDCTIIKLVDCNKKDNYEIYKGRNSCALENLSAEILKNKIFFAIKTEQDIIDIYIR